MRNYQKKNHSVDLLFTVALFCMFALSAMVILIAGANVYRGVNARGELEYNTMTPLSYIEQKVRQHDYSGGVTVTDINGTAVLCLHTTKNDVGYTTYIYESNGELKEAFWKDGTEPDLSTGTGLMDLESLSFGIEGDRLLRIELDDGKNNVNTSFIQVSSQGGLRYE